MLRYNINPDSDIPIYRQLVDQINAAIRSGALKTGTQMPTVREMAQQLHLSCGTVKRVYDTLREMGDIEMTRRRGSFVKYVREDRDSRKIRAMAAIDLMIRQLTDMSFSPAEIQIFVNLKMREWGLKWSGVRVALIAPCPECAAVYERQLASIANVQVMICDLKQIREYPYSIDEQSDVILASVQDCQQLSGILPDADKLVRVAFAPDQQDMLRLSRADARRIGVVCESDAYFQLARACAPAEAELILCSAENAEGYDCVVSAEAREGWLRLEDRIDAGSMINLEERIKRIRGERMLRPAGIGFAP